MKHWQNESRVTTTITPAVVCGMDQSDLAPKQPGEATHVIYTRQGGHRTPRCWLAYERAVKLSVSAFSLCPDFSGVLYLQHHVFKISKGAARFQNNAQRIRDTMKHGHFTSN